MMSSFGYGRGLAPASFYATPTVLCSPTTDQTHQAHPGAVTTDNRCMFDCQLDTT